VQTLAGNIARHLQLPTGCIIVNFREMKEPGRVELTAKDPYIVDVHSRYKINHRDIAAILAHEITHVFLHRHGIGFPNTEEDEILTDTTSVFLGVGWLGLNAYRVTKDRQVRGGWFSPREVRVTTTEERLGYLTPSEFGYVLAKRSLAFKERSDRLLTSRAAVQAYRNGAQYARREYRCPPLSRCGWLDRVKYYSNRRNIRRANGLRGLNGMSRHFRGYRFDFSDAMRVIFGCPECGQELRLPTDKSVQARCPVCKTSFECKT
jgi:hypothetical protein